MEICRGAAENATSQNKLIHPNVAHKVGRLTQGNGETRRSKSSVKLLTHDFPAYRKICLKCRGKNHFKRKCTSAGASANMATDSKASCVQVHQVADRPSSSDGEWLNTVGSGGRDLKCRMFVGGKEVTFQIDTRSSVSMLPAWLAEQIEPTEKVLKMWNHTRLSPLGKSKQRVLNPKNGEVYPLGFIVFRDNFYFPSWLEGI